SLLGAQRGRAELSADALASFWNWARALLRGRDEGLRIMRAHFEAALQVPPQLGSLLAEVDAPGELLRAMYTELEPQRRRARFFGRYEGLHDDVESILVLRIGLYAAVNWYQSGRPDSASDLFWWIYTAAR